MNKAQTLLTVTALTLVSGCRNIQETQNIPTMEPLPTMILPDNEMEYMRMICSSEFNLTSFNTSQEPSLPDSTTVSVESRLNALKNFHLITFTDILDRMSQEELEAILDDMSKQFDGTTVGPDLNNWINNVQAAGELGPGASSSFQIIGSLFDEMKNVVDCDLEG